MARYFIDLKIFETRSDVYELEKLSLKIFNKKKLLEDRLRNLKSLKN